MKNTLILMHGLPGSGKSSIDIIKDFKYYSSSSKYAICSTDSIWNGEEGYHYLFVGKFIGVAHRINQAKVDEAMSRNIQTVIVDNTNLTFKECEPYCVLAKQYGYVVKIIEPDTTWKDEPYQCWAHNKHNVQAGVIKKMADRQEDINDIRCKIELFMKAVCDEVLNPEGEADAN